ncbi:helix-turn-helix domain-containing protein [Myxococcus sp. K38C18041901]|uniref:helix-turn-helix domain-containing protein n=1 Tax=Myxococcus guangdongensis TaxID=2906760 RepID=UPI0020A81A32|nr:helix-turn-helix transcriptional regulator [Myxococcus guangdongensis]MCP3060982.1 helix-turn-helix domain-containing protein [Myxococcus guangdongensis]
MRKATSASELRQHLSSIVGPTARAARSQLGLTQAEVAQQMGLASEVYSRLERGKMLPSLTTLHRLCEALDVSPDELLGFTRATPPSTETPARRRLFFRVRQLDETRARAMLTLLSRGKSHE